MKREGKEEEEDEEVVRSKIVTRSEKESGKRE